MRETTDEMNYPKYIQNVERREDMSPEGKIMLFRQDDGDVILTIYTKEKGLSGVEFCTSGGQSPNTHLALCELMVAIEKDNNA